MTNKPGLFWLLSCRGEEGAVHGFQHFNLSTCGELSAHLFAFPGTVQKCNLLARPAALKLCSVSSTSFCRAYKTSLSHLLGWPSFNQMLCSGGKARDFLTDSLGSARSSFASCLSEEWERCYQDKDQLSLQVGFILGIGEGVITLFPGSPFQRVNHTAFSACCISKDLRVFTLFIPCTASFLDHCLRPVINFSPGVEKNNSQRQDASETLKNGTSLPATGSQNH